MTQRGRIVRCVAIAAVVIAGYLSVVGYEDFHGSIFKYRLLSDDYNRGSVYFPHAQFLPQHKVPYLEVPSEYPTIATLAFAAPLLFGPHVTLSREAYCTVWSSLMAVLFLATVWMVATFRARQGLSVEPVLTLLAPSPLYFSLTRFDVLATIVVIASLAAFSRRRYTLAHVLVGIGTFIKWYPALVFLVYVAFHVTREPRRDLRPAAWLRTATARYASAYVATVGLIIATSIAAFTWNGFWFPYRFHLLRGGQDFNLYYVFERLNAPHAIPTAARRVLNLTFLLLQFSIVPILWFKRVETVRDVMRYAFTGIVLFIMFARVSSPEWILWYLPVGLMFVRDRRTLAMLAFLGFWNYLVFPVAFLTLWPSTGYTLIALFREVSVVGLLALVLREPQGAPQPDLAH